MRFHGVPLGQFTTEYKAAVRQSRTYAGFIFTRGVESRYQVTALIADNAISGADAIIPADCHTLKPANPKPNATAAQTQDAMRAARTLRFRIRLRKL